MDYKVEISALLSKLTGIESAEIHRLMEIPPQPEMGDYAFPCFTLSKQLRKSPVAIAVELASDPTLNVDYVDSVRAQGPYVNFFIDKGHFSKAVISEIILKGEQYAASDIGQGKTVIVEFSSPNIAKPFHVGHAFTTVLGHSLSRIYEKLGYNVVRVNHLGDYGTQFGKLITAYRLWGEESALEASPIDELLRIYVLFHEKEKDDPELTQTARDNFRRLEAGNPEEKALWQRFRDLSLKAFAQVYNRMGVAFDSYKGESDYSDHIPSVISFLEEKDLLVDSEGARVVMLDEYKLPPCLVVKSDGTTIYASRDLAAAMYRHEHYNFHKNIYVVGLPQSLHFQQVFAVLDKAGLDYAKDCEHVGFGLVKFKNMKFSTREGNIVVLEDLLNESIAKTLEIIKTNAALRQSDMTEEEILEIANKVGIGSVIYTYLKSGRERDIVFSWEEMLDFDGDSAPYLIYTYARTRSILRKAIEQGIRSADAFDDSLSLLTTEEEFALVKLLSDLPEAIEKAASSNEPFMLSRQVSRIARAFNRFYNNSSILGGADDHLRSARLALCEAVCTAIKTGTYLLGIDVVERM